MCDGSPD